MSLPTEVIFFLTEVFFPVHADSSFVGASDMSPEVHCNLCNKCYTLGMPGPRPELDVYSTYPKYILRYQSKFQYQVEHLRS